MTLSTPGDSTAVVGEIAGREVALRYVGVPREYAALRERAMLVDRSHRTRMLFEGQQRLETLTGLVTNDVAALSPGTGLYAAALTPRGKIIADVRIFATEDAVLVDLPARAAPGWTAMIRKYVNPRVTKYTDRTDATATLGLYGVRAREMVAGLTGLEEGVLAALGPFGHVSAAVDEHPVRVARVPDLGLEGFDLFIPADARAALWHRAVDRGAVAAGMEAWDVARVEAGRPEWGVDIDDTTIPQEANFDELHAISYTKGCYTGQETVARVHFRGHVNRHLRGIMFPTPDAVPAGAALLGEGEKSVGDVRSSVLSPRLGAIALAMVRREVAPGATVRVRWAEFDVPAQVVALPFPADGA